MHDASRDDDGRRLAPVSYLPWAVPGAGPGGSIGVEPPSGAAAERSGRSRAGSAGARKAGTRTGSRAASRTATSTGDAEIVEIGGEETGVERDERIDRLVVGRLRRASLSVAEVRDVLTEHGLDDAEVEDWIARYERLGYLNDVRLAEQLVRTGAERRGRGSAAILAELARRGVDAAATRAALDELDPDLERRNALAVAERRAKQLGGLDRAVAERRLTAFLQRRGYASDVIREAVTAALPRS